MQTLYSRSRVALHLVALPFIFAGHVAREAFSAAKDAAADIRYDFLPAVRYVVTGCPDTTVSSAAANQARKAASVAASAYATHAHIRLSALLVLAVLPALMAFALLAATLEAVRREFTGLGGSIVDLVRAIVTGRVNF